MKKNFFTIYMLVVWFVTTVISLFAAADFLVDAYHYYDVAVNHNSSTYYQINKHSFEDTLTDKSFKRALGDEAQKMTTEEITHQRLEEQGMIIAREKHDIVRSMINNVIYLLIAFTAFYLHRRWFERYKNQLE